MQGNFFAGQCKLSILFGSDQISRNYCFLFTFFTQVCLYSENESKLSQPRHPTTSETESMDKVYRSNDNEETVNEGRVNTTQRKKIVLIIIGP